MITDLSHSLSFPIHSDGNHDSSRDTCKSILRVLRSPGPSDDLSKSNPVPADVKSYARRRSTRAAHLAHLPIYLNIQIFVHSQPTLSLPTMSQSLPSSTTVLVVGAGPAGIACALSLWSSGVRDIVIVDAVPVIIIPCDCCPRRNSRGEIS
jgi:hypothetical protein